ncbi:hypothetical protein GZL_06629 [Streptomyces sp. 769]|nr:hypothetical protein GZL_06629 [Streptomyces sp. 769]
MREDHDVAQVLLPGPAEAAAAGDQAELGAVGLAVDLLVGEVPAVVDLHRIDGEHRDPPVGAQDPHGVPLLQGAQAVEDRGARAGVHMAGDQGGAGGAGRGAVRVPARQVPVALRRRGEAAVRGQLQPGQRRVDAQGRHGHPERLGGRQR